MRKGALPHTLCETLLLQYGRGYVSGVMSETDETDTDRADRSPFDGYLRSESGFEKQILSGTKR